MSRSTHVVNAAGSTLDVRPKEAYEIITAGARVLDVRSKEEFAASRVSGAINVPIFNLSPVGMVPNPAFLQGVKEAFPDVDEQIVVHCKSGGRSRTAADLLKSEYTNLVHMDGGFMEWEGTGLPVDK